MPMRRETSSAHCSSMRGPSRARRRRRTCTSTGAHPGDAQRGGVRRGGVQDRARRAAPRRTRSRSSSSTTPSPGRVQRLATLLEGAGQTQQAKRGVRPRAAGGSRLLSGAHAPRPARDERGRHDGRVSELAIAADIATSDPFVHYMNGWVLGKAKHTKEAIAELTKATALEAVLRAAEPRARAQYEAAGESTRGDRGYDGFSSWRVRAIHSASSPPDASRT